MTPFIFDFTLSKNNIRYAETETEAQKIVKEIQEKCPYTVPTIKDIIKLIEKATYKVNKSTFISDTFECGALAISNLVDLTQYDEREEQYKKTIAKYPKAEQNLMTEVFAQIFALLSSVTYDDGQFGDYLGELFMQCNLGNKCTGQFFTPYHISEFMARATFIDKDIERDKILTINDPCCGSGGLMMAALDVLKNVCGINYAQDCFIECSDIDIRCVYMAYLQLSLAGAPAIIKHQNSLTQETWSVWKTPAFIFQYPRFAKYDY